MSNIKEEDLKNVNGGSWFISEEDGKKAGLTLQSEDKTPGSWGYLYNSGDYYWKGQKVSMTEANAIVHFTNDRGVSTRYLGRSSEVFQLIYFT